MTHGSNGNGTHSSFEWIVAGAGPAGIAAVGLLLDAGIDERQICWIDPEFQVGDFGTAWRRVLSNTAVEYFLKFYRATPSFRFEEQRAPFFIESLPNQHLCFLGIAAQPLLRITDHLKSRVKVISDRVLKLTPQNRWWQVRLTSGQTLQAQKVVMAIGAEPKRLRFTGMQEIPLTAALHPELLKQQIEEGDRVVVFGDAQSARSVLQNLSTVSVRPAFHFYHSISSIERHLADEDLAGIQSMPCTPAHLLQTIPQCNKAIYAVGFQRRSILIDGLPDDFGYDPETGVIAPGVFGLGIAFPEIRLHELGRPQYHVAAIWPVLKRLQRLLPLWLSAQGIDI